MNLPRFAVRHPIFIIMVSLIVLILGSISLSRLPIDLMPDITLPRLSIYTNYENAGPEEVEELVKLPGLGEKKAQTIKQAAEDFIKEQASLKDVASSPSSEEA